MIHPLTIISSADKPQSSGRVIPYLPQEEGVAEVCGRDVETGSGIQVQ